MKARNLLRTPFSIFALFAILFLIKSCLFRDIFLTPTKIFQLWQATEGKLWATRSLMAFFVFMNIRALSIQKEPDHTSGQCKHPPYKKPLRFTRNKKLLENILFCIALKSIIETTSDLQVQDMIKNQVRMRVGMEVKLKEWCYIAARLRYASPWETLSLAIGKMLAVE